jgi:hypothetical protein
VIESADKVDTAQPTRQSRTVEETHDSELEGEVLTVLMDEVVGGADDVISSPVSLSPGGQLPTVTPKTSMQVKLKLGIPGHANSILVRLGARPHTSTSSP